MILQQHSYKSQTIWSWHTSVKTNMLETDAQRYVTDYSEQCLTIFSFKQYNEAYVSVIIIVQPWWECSVKIVLYSCDNNHTIDNATSNSMVSAIYMRILLYVPGTA